MSALTFAMIKPGAVHRGLVGSIIKRFEDRGLNIVALKMIKVTKKQAQEHYFEHRDKPFFSELVDSIMSGPVVVLLICGEQAIELVRNMAGATDPLKSIPGTIRGDFSADLTNNIIHTADSEESVVHESEIYFSVEERIKYNRITDIWSFENVTSKNQEK